MLLDFFLVCFFFFFNFSVCFVWWTKLATRQLCTALYMRSIVSYSLQYLELIICAVIRLQVIFPSHFDHVSYLHFVQFSNHPYLICALAMFATTERHYCRREQQFTTISQTVRSYQPLYRRIKLNIFTRSQLLSAGGYCFWSRHVVRARGLIRL